MCLLDVLTSAPRIGSGNSRRGACRRLRQSPSSRRREVAKPAALMLASSQIGSTFHDEDPEREQPASALAPTVQTSGELYLVVSGRGMRTQDVSRRFPHLWTAGGWPNRLARWDAREPSLCAALNRPACSMPAARRWQRKHLAMLAAVRASAINRVAPGQHIHHRHVGAQATTAVGQVVLTP